MPPLDPTEQAKLIDFSTALIDQERACVAIPPQANASGFWFGGGNMIEGPDRELYLVGRYRNVGDSRTGLNAGERGLELAIFRSDDRGESFSKVLSFTKADLSVGNREVLSIEGSALHWTDDGIELFVSSEKSGIAYPPGLEEFLKPGTGVWTIELLRAKSIEALADARRETILESNDPGYLHFKDPAIYESANGDALLMFCTHPYCWSSSNTACCLRPRGATAFGPPLLSCFPRGTTWDVAIARGTCILDVPPVGAFSGPSRRRLLFYDGGESLRNLDEHAAAVSRPRGYSCEELGGLAYFDDSSLRSAQRLSTSLPLFISPHGTGCSRYVDVLATDDGYYATWQQSQADLSQPLVINRLSHEEAEAIVA